MALLAGVLAALIAASLAVNFYQLLRLDQHDTRLENQVCILLVEQRQGQAAIAKAVHAPVPPIGGSCR